MARTRTATPPTSASERPLVRFAGACPGSAASTGDTGFGVGGALTGAPLDGAALDGAALTGAALTGKALLGTPLTGTAALVVAVLTSGGLDRLPSATTS